MEIAKQRCGYGVQGWRETVQVLGAGNVPGWESGREETKSATPSVHEYWFSLLGVVGGGVRWFLFTCLSFFAIDNTKQ